MCFVWIFPGPSGFASLCIECIGVKDVIHGGKPLIEFHILPWLVRTGFCETSKERLNTGIGSQCIDVFNAVFHFPFGAPREKCPQVFPGLNP